MPSESTDKAAGADFTYPRGHWLVSTDWLAANLDVGDVRVFDCTTHLIPDPDPKRVYSIKPGVADHAAGHVPGAVHLDIQNRLSDTSSDLRFKLPDPETLAAAFGEYGIGDGVRVVLYACNTPQWATRVWWMLRFLGFDNAYVLDGGITAWAAEGRPVATEITSYPKATLTPAPRPEVIVDADGVLEAINNPNAQVINALARDQHEGRGRVYGRPGRVAGSVCLTTAELFSAETGRFLPPGEIAARFADIGTKPGERYVAYCGGGIAASATTFLLTLLGYDDVALYDNSLGEWSVREDLPMETGPGA